MQTSPKPVRSAGTLTAHPPVTDPNTGRFRVDLTFKCPHVIGEDEMRSAMMQAAVEVKKLLIRNGYWRYRNLQTSVKMRRSNREAVLTVECTPEVKPAVLLS